MQFPCLGLGTVQAKQGGIGGFVPGFVGALGLTQRFGVGLHIENIVADLEGQADGIGIVVEVLALFLRGGRVAQGTEADTRLEQGAGLVAVHGLQLFQRQALALCGSVDGLAAGHAT